MNRFINLPRGESILDRGTPTDRYITKLSSLFRPLPDDSIIAQCVPSDRQSFNLSGCNLARPKSTSTTEAERQTRQEVDLSFCSNLPPPRKRGNFVDCEKEEERNRFLFASNEEGRKKRESRFVFNFVCISIFILRYVNFNKLQYFDSSISRSINEWIFHSEFFRSSKEIRVF